VTRCRTAQDRRSGRPAGHRPFELSGRAAAARGHRRALANDPAIILADEPTGNLDSTTGSEIIEMLSTFNRQRRVTIITATHDHKMLAASSRVVWIADGRIERIERREDLHIAVGSIDGRS